MSNKETWGCTVINRGKHSENENEWEVGRGPKVEQKNNSGKSRALLKRRIPTLAIN